MKYLDSIRRAGRSLSNAKGRTFLTSMAIAVGAFTITLALAAGTGINNLVDTALSSNINPRSISVAKAFDYEAAFTGGNGIEEYDPEAEATGGSNPNDVTEYTISQQQVDAIDALDEIERTNLVLQFSPQYVNLEDSDTRYSVDMASAYDPDILLKEVSGDLPELSEPLPDQSAVISKRLAESFSDPDDVIGKDIVMQMVNSASGETREFRLPIVAVTEPGQFSFVSGDLYLSRDAAVEVNDFTTSGTPMFERYYGVAAVTADDYEPEQARDAIEAADDTLDAQTAKEVSDQLFQIVNIATYVVVGFGAIALIAAVFGIINTQYISVLERTREIGLMKALGMRGRHVRRLFQLEAAWIGALGGIIGALLGWLATVLLNPWINEQLKLEEGNLLMVEFLPVVILIAALTLIAMLAGWFPSRKAAKLDPIEALRTE